MQKAGSNYLEDLMKIANPNNEVEKNANVSSETLPEDLDTETMNPEPMPQQSQEEIDRIQTENATDDPEPVEDQNPPSPEESEEIQDVVDDAGEELRDELEQEATEEQGEDFEKLAEDVEDFFYSMNTLASLIKVATMSEDENLRKEAEERLDVLTDSEEGYTDVLQKTANELFASEAYREHATSEEGMEQMARTLEMFSSDELEKVAAPSVMNKVKFGQIGPKVRQGAADYVTALRDYGKRKGNMQALRAKQDEVTQLGTRLRTEADVAAARGNQALQQSIKNQQLNQSQQFSGVANELLEAERLMAQSQLAGGATVGGLAGAGLLSGIGLKRHLNNRDEGEEAEEMLSEKNASDTMNQDSDAFTKKGGCNTMTKERELVNSFLKVAGAAGLVGIANNEQMDQGIRKEAAEAFNDISRLGQSDMSEAFVKVAQQIYDQNELREIVAGHHTDGLLEKVAFFTDAYEASADELEKVAGAESVAAKGVGGALTDAKKQIEETVDKDKEKTETVKQKQGSKPAGSMQGYNVINNPGEYDVDKTATYEDDVALVKQAAEEFNYIAQQFEERYGR